MPKKPPLYPHVPKSQMRETEQDLPFERDVREANELISQALDILTVGPGLEAPSMDDFDSALWRLVDAAGITARYASRTATGTRVNPTGRGYFIEQT